MSRVKILNGARVGHQRDQTIKRPTAKSRGRRRSAELALLLQRGGSTGVVQFHHARTGHARKRLQISVSSGGGSPSVGAAREARNRAN